MIPFDVAGQPRRRTLFLHAVREEARRYFSASGVWIGPGPAPECREWLWTVFAQLEGGAEDVAQASRLIEQAVPPGTPEYPFCVFANNHAAHLLATQAAAFTPAARRRLEGWARQAVGENAGSRQAALQFHGYNDNMPAKATLGMILGGEYFGDEAAVGQGLWNLHQLRLLLARRGVISEHCSPTYSPLTLANLTAIAHHARSPEARRLAGDCAARLWAELLAHYHAPTRAVVGPFSRAYTTDSVGHTSALHLLLWLVFGPECVPDPLAELRRAPVRLIVHHAGDSFFVLICFAFVAATSFEPPAALVDWAQARRFPFRFQATTERGEGGTLGAGPAAWPAQEVGVQCFQSGTFAVGTSNGDWVNQAERWHVVYRRSAQARDWADVRHLTLRYLVDDEGPGRRTPSPRGDFAGEPDLVPEHGWHHTLQADAVTLVASRPVLGLAGRPLKRMGLAILIPEHLNRVENLHWDAGHVWLEDGAFQLAIRPLGRRPNAGSNPPVEFREAGAYRLVYFPDYAGEARVFTAEELSATAGGIVALAASREEISAAEFRARVLAADLLDYIWNNQRIVQWHCSGRSLEISYGLMTDGVRYGAVDGQAIRMVPWQADGLPMADLPLAGSGRERNPHPFPFQSDGYRWREFPSAIFARPDNPGRSAT